MQILDALDHVIEGIDTSFLNMETAANELSEMLDVQTAYSVLETVFETLYQHTNQSGWLILALTDCRYIPKIDLPQDPEIGALSSLQPETMHSAAREYATKLLHLTDEQDAMIVWSKSGNKLVVQQHDATHNYYILVSGATPEDLWIEGYCTSDELGPALQVGDMRLHRVEHEHLRPIIYPYFTPGEWMGADWRIAGLAQHAGWIYDAEIIIRIPEAVETGVGYTNHQRIVMYRKGALNYACINDNPQLTGSTLGAKLSDVAIKLLEKVTPKGGTILTYQLPFIQGQNYGFTQLANRSEDERVEDIQGNS